MRLGISELILIAIVGIIVIKPEKLKDYVKSFYKAKETIAEAKAEVDDEINKLVKDSDTERTSYESGV